MMVRYSFPTFLSVYHRAITFTTRCSLTPVLICTTLQSCFILSYNPLYLLCARSQVTTSFIGDNQKDVIEDTKKEALHCNLNVGGDLQFLEVSNKPVAILDALTRFDPSKGFVISNLRSSYVNLSRFRPLKFVKARSSDHANHFWNPETGLWYEEYRDAYDNYLDRPLNLEELCLFQFMSWYEKMPGSSEACSDAYDTSEEVDTDTTVEGKIVMATTDSGVYSSYSL